MLDLASAGYDRWAIPSNQRLPISARHIHVIHFVAIPGGDVASLKFEQLRQSFGEYFQCLRRYR